MCGGCFGEAQEMSHYKKLTSGLLNIEVRERLTSIIYVLSGDAHMYHLTIKRPYFLIINLGFFTTLRPY